MLSWAGEPAHQTAKRSGSGHPTRRMAMVQKLFEVASRVTKPLSLSGLVVTALYLVYRAILALDIFAPLGEEHTFGLLSIIADRLFYMALLALVLGVVSYVFVQHMSKPQAAVRTEWEITGNVLFDDGHPVEGATVFVDGVDRKKQTDSTGWFQIKVDEQEKWTVRASHQASTARRVIRRKNVDVPTTLTIPKPTPPRTQRSPGSVAFVIEGVRPTSTGFRVLFSIWNETRHGIKVFEFTTREYARIVTVMYYGGQRHRLRLRQGDKTTLWSGETYEIPSTESASFELEYTVDTGPADGRPWIVFGIIAHFHDPCGGKRQVPSDAVLVYRHGICTVVDPARLEALRDQSQPEHVGRVESWATHIYEATKRSLEQHHTTPTDK